MLEARETWRGAARDRERPDLIVVDIEEQAACVKILRRSCVRSGSRNDPMVVLRAGLGGETRVGFADYGVRREALNPGHHP